MKHGQIGCSRATHASAELRQEEGGDECPDMSSFQQDFFLSSYWKKKKSKTLEGCLLTLEQ